jgi:hypothetical protein
MESIPRQTALTRSKFDLIKQADDMRITSYGGAYRLNEPNKNCPTSFVVNATSRIQGSGAGWVSNEWKTNVESDLKGINRLGSRVRGENIQYNPETNVMNKKGYTNAPDEVFHETFNRLNNPPCTLRASGWNRWEPLPHNPQLTTETPFDFFIPSRLQDKERCKTHTTHPK